MVRSNSCKRAGAKSAAQIEADSVLRNKTGDRRWTVRYPLAARLGYTLPNRGEISGYGTTVNVSSHGVLFQGDRTLLPGISIEFWIEWPVLLDAHVGLRLHGVGRIVRVDGTHMAVETSRYEFRTRPLSKALSMAAAR